MGCFWWILYSSNPAFCLLGYLGLLGEEAQEAAEEFTIIYLLAFMVIVICALIYGLLKLLGVV